MTKEICGFCSGSGQTYGSMYDNHGHKRHDEPPVRVCEYCGGNGTLEDGNKLLPSPSREEIIRRQSD